MKPGDLIPHPLTHVRHLRDWTLSDVASIVARRSGLNMACRREKVWRWEQGKATPERAAQEALAAELGIPAQAIDSNPWPGWLSMVDPIEPTDAPWTPDANEKILAHVLESGPMDRRSFLVFSGANIANITALWSSEPPQQVYRGIAGSRVGAATVDCLESRLEDLWRLDDLLGGGSCLDAGISDLRLVAKLLRRASYDSQVGLRLWTSAASLARFTGWAAFDTGRNALAQRYWHAALRAAHSGGDMSQGIYILSNLALQEIYERDGLAAIHLLDAARDQVDPAMRTVLAMLDTWQARAHAILGEAAQAAHLLNRADDLWAQRCPEDDPSWVYWMPQPSLTAEAGTALLEIGETRRAEESLAQGLASLGSGSARDRNLYLIRLADTQYADGRPDQALLSAHLAIDTLTSSPGMDSPRVDARVNAFLRKLPRQEAKANELRDYWKTRLSERLI